MATTYDNSAETRLIFKLERGEDRTTRTISIPGAIANESNLSAVLTAWRSFRNSILNGSSTTKFANYLTQFVQPTQWRDITGSTLSTEDDPPWTTYDVEIEFYTVEKTRYSEDT